MMEKIPLASLRLGGLLVLTTLLAACAATTSTTNQTPKYNGQECKQMRGRGVIDLDQYKKCIYGQPFEILNKES